jgi:hypothetical protein
MIKVISKKEAAIISAYTGVLLGDFKDFHKYIEEILGRPLLSHELHKESIVGEIKEKSRDDFLNLKVED